MAPRPRAQRAALLSALLLGSAPSTTTPTTTAAPPGGGGGGRGGTLRRLSPALSTVFFVGDTHGDEVCCREWVRRTGLVDLGQQPWVWVGAADTAIVLLGDYVDKGPESRGALPCVHTPVGCAAWAVQMYSLGCTSHE
jgi:hypothetical protein